MAKFRKKPVVIDAWLVGELLAAAKSADGSYWLRVDERVRDATVLGNLVFRPDFIAIKTLEGVMRAEPFDWLIRGVAGEFYPCKPEIFAKTYDSADGAS